MTERKSRLDRIEELLAKLTEENLRRAEEDRRRGEADRTWAEEDQRRVEKWERGMETLRKEVGKVSNGLGYFAEGLIAPNIPRLLKEFGLSRAGVGCREERHLNGTTIEIDLLAVARAGRRPTIVVIEVSAHLTQKEVNAVLGKIEDVPAYFEEYARHDIMGAVAGMQVRRDAIRYAERKGLIAIGPADETACVMNRPGFRPRVIRRGR